MTKNITLEEKLKLENKGQDEVYELDFNYSICDYFKLLKIKINTNMDEDLSYLLNIFPHISYLLQEEMDDKTLLKINKLVMETKEEVHKHLEKMDEDSMNYKTLELCLDQLESISLAYLYDFLEKYNGSTYHFLSYLLFEYKNLQVIKESFEKYPYLVNVKDNNNRGLYEITITKYLDSLRRYTLGLEDIRETRYFDKVLTLLIQNEKFKITEEEYKNILRKLKEVLTHLPTLELSSYYKEKYAFWILNLIEKFEGKEPIVSDEVLQYKFDIEEKFSPAIISLAKRDIIIPKRKMVDAYTIAIDDTQAEEIDDALSIEKLEDGTFLLGVHIADANSSLENYPLLLENAVNRGTSIYLSDKTIPLFPEVLAKNKLSLLANRPRLANSFYMKINQKGEVEDYYFEESIINLSKNISYSECDKILNFGFCTDLKLLETLLNLNEVTNYLQKRFVPNELYTYTNRQEKNVSNTVLTGVYRSMKIVESAMVITNHTVANHFNKNHLPFVYRNHKMDEELKRKVNEIKQEAIDIRNRDFIKIINRLNLGTNAAVYDSKNLGHDGLNLDCYTHITSPLRRSADILASMCLKEFYFKENRDAHLYYLEDYLTETLKKINRKCLDGTEYMKEYEKQKNKTLN